LVTVQPYNYSYSNKVEEATSSTRKSPVAAGDIHSSNGEGMSDLYKGFFDKPTDWLLAIFTGFLVLYTRRLYQATVGLVNAASDQGQDTKAAVEIAAKQVAIIAVQTEIQQKQHAISRLQFLATHRPRLRVRHITVDDPGKRTGLPTFFFEHDKEVRGGLVVVNVGGSNATIIETRHRIFFSKSGLPAAAPYDEDFRQNMLLPNQVLASGESCATPITDTIVMQPNPPGETKLRTFEREGWVIYVMGQIRYKDDGGAERFMGFCRVRQKDGRFRPVNDPDYEYED
jgi:hypothetical protein